MDIQAQSDAFTAAARPSPTTFQLASQRLTWRYQAFVGGAQDGLHLAFPGPSTVQGLKFASLLTSQRH